MRKTRLLASLSGLAVVGSVLLVPPASAEPTTPAAKSTSEGRGPGTAATVDPLEQARVAKAAAAAPAVADPIEMPSSYPYQPELRLYRDNADDAAKTAALLGHPDLAPKLKQWMAASDRISTQVIGQSTEGRDLYLVTVTAPERPEDTAQQAAWRDKIKSDPVAAKADAQLLSQYKTPVWVSANIHGNEWEGTDAVMQYIDWLVTASDAEVGSILRNNRLYFSLSLNPDGRTNATRATALGLDPNRDMITNTTPESTSFVRQAQAIQPIYSADLHGYTSVLQVEPTGPPHGSNYEYDVYLPHNYAMALKVEQEVVAANIPNNTYFNTTTGAVVPANTGPETAHIKIPYRDTPDGWDDFPPIFTAQYAAFYGAATSTVELPLTRGAAGGRQTPARAVVNTAVGLETVKSMVEYMNVAANARGMLENQIEVFRRGEAGAAKTALTTENIANVPGPQEWKPLWDVVDNQEPVTLPRAYVIPAGDSQRSASDASALVDKLLFNDIEVGVLDAPAAIGGTTYPAGSYVVDMHQPLRGLANALLDLGEDISPKVPSMYDISAWSYSYLWGATVDKVGLTSDGPLPATTPVDDAAPVGDAPDEAGYLTFDLAGVRDFRGLNALLEDGVEVSMLEDGSAVVGPEDFDAAVLAADEFDIAFEAASAEDVAALDDEGTKGLTDLTIAYVGTQDDRLSLIELGFDDIKPITAAAINTAATNGTPTGLEGVDLLWVGSAFNPAAGSPGRLAVQSWVDAGGSIVGRSGNAFTAASSFGLVSGTAVAGNGSGNGIVDVDTPADSVLAPYAQESSFIYPATWFTPGEGTRVLQTYGTDPLLAGHWRPSGAGTNGPGNAAGQPSVIAGEAASGARAVVFGTSVFYRTHVKGGMSQAARAIFWAGPTGDGVQAPSSTTVALTTDSSIRYPQAARFGVTVTSDEGTPNGTVALRDRAGRTVASATLVEGAATLVVKGLEPGRSSFTAVYTPAGGGFESASSESVDVVVAKATSTTRLTVKKVQARVVRATVSLTIPGMNGRGTVQIKDKGRTVRTVTVSGGRKAVVLRLGKGRHVLTAVFAGSGRVAPSRSTKVVVIVR